MQTIENELKGIEKRFKWFSESIEETSVQFRKDRPDVINVLLNEMEELVDRKQILITRLGEANESSTTD